MVAIAEYLRALYLQNKVPSRLCIISHSRVFYYWPFAIKLTWFVGHAQGMLGIEFQETPRREFEILRGCADMSLALPTSQCRRTESIVSLETGACSCTEFHVFSCYRGWKEACQATRAISTTWRSELSSSFFFLQGKAPKDIHAILTEILGEHAPSYATIKNWVAQFKRGDFFHLWCASSWTTQNSDHPGDYWSNSRDNLGRPPDFRLNQ